MSIIGAGNMGRALVGGLVRRDADPSAIGVGESSEAARASLQREFGVRASADNRAALAGAQVVVLAVKPQDAAGVVRALAPELGASRAVVISVMAGIELAALQRWCGQGVPLVRAMPNRPAILGAGATAVYAPPEVGAGERTLAERALSAVGSVVWLQRESDLDVVTALSGSGPAYFFLLAELMADAAVGLGLEPAAARALAVGTLYGAGALAHSSDGDLARLRAEVTSRGGTTEAALRVLAGNQGLEAIVQRALAAAAQRSRELARQFGAETP